MNKSGPRDRASSPKSDRSPVASLSKAWVCDRSLAGIKGSNAAGDIAVCLLLSAVCCQVVVVYALSFKSGLGCKGVYFTSATTL